MLVAEVYRRLALGKLKNLSVTEGSDIKDSQKEAIVAYLNTSLKKLYGLLVLKEETLIVQTMEGLTTYKLTPDYAISGAELSGKTPYIIDSAENPFKGDLAQVLAVVDSNGIPRPINKAQSWNSIQLITHNTVQIPYSEYPDLMVAFQYQAYLPDIPNDSPEEYFDLPVMLEEALLSHIAYQAYTDMGSQENLAIGQVHKADFMNEVETARNRNIAGQSEISTTDRFRDNGWV